MSLAATKIRVANFLCEDFLTRECLFLVSLFNHDLGAIEGYKVPHSEI